MCYIIVLFDLKNIVFLLDQILQNCYFTFSTPVISPSTFSITTLFDVAIRNTHTVAPSHVSLFSGRHGSPKSE
jgi:hypothetical protein